MAAHGALLDIHAGMKPVSCAVDEFFPGKGPDSCPLPGGSISVAGKKFPQRVLVVDDEPLIRWSVAESLSDLGYDVEQASDAAAALYMVTASAVPFDVVVLDLRLPDMHDLSLLSTLRQLIPAATLILMTAFSTPEIVADAKALGAAVMNKPFELDALKKLVAESGTPLP
jgi:DNA-binding NtrC family response regulator